MSLQARAINNENAGVPRAASLKPGEAPSKQAGLGKRKGLSEMGDNQALGSRGLTAGPKAATKTTAKVVRKKKPTYDEPIELMFPASDSGLTFRDPLVEHSLSCDLTKDITWSIGETGYEDDYFARENRRFGLSVDEDMSFAAEPSFLDSVPDIPDLDLGLYDC